MGQGRKRCRRNQSARGKYAASYHPREQLSQDTYICNTSEILHAILLRSHVLLCSGLTDRTGRWSAPAHVRTLLNLFSGQLYFDSGEEYAGCGLLALSIAHPGAK